MFTHQNHNSGPTGAARLVRGAFAGAVVTLVLIPVFRKVLAELAAVNRSLMPDGGPFAEQLTLTFQMANISFVLLPLASTLGAIVFAYSNLGVIGVGLYLVLSGVATGALLGSAIAMGTFVLGATATGIVWTLTSSRQTGRGPPVRRYR